MEIHKRSTITAMEAIVVVAICFGWAILESWQAVISWSQLPSASTGEVTASVSVGFSDDQFLSLIATELVLAAIAAYFLACRRYDIGGLYPQPSARGCLHGLMLYAGGTMLYWLLLAAARTNASAEPIQTALQHSTISLKVLVSMAVVNGAYEEIFLLGFLSRGLRHYGASVAVGIPLLVRVLYHTYQGPLAVTSICILGLLWGCYYFRTQSLFPVVFAHMLADIVPFVWS